MVCNFCNGICDLFVMVLEFSVMVLLFFCFFQQGCLIVFMQCILSHFKGCCWLRFVFITTKNIILIRLCILLFEVTKPWLICGYHGYKNHDFILFFFVLKPWLTFVSEHGNSERILDALLKLLPTLKHVINHNTQKSSCGCENGASRFFFFEHLDGAPPPWELVPHANCVLFI